MKTLKELQDSAFEAQLEFAFSHKIPRTEREQRIWKKLVNRYNRRFNEYKNSLN